VTVSIGEESDRRAMKPSCLAVIPARGGSKSIPRKNVLPVAGRPLLALTIDAAIHARQVDRVVVSTEDAEIAQVAEDYGAEVVWRPAAISGDLAASEDALLHVLEVLDRERQYRPDLLAFLQCTSPLTASEDIDGTIDALHACGADSALAVTDFHYFLWRPDESGGVVGINHDPRRRQLRQQREPQYVETGAVYVMRTEGFQSARHRFFGKTAMYCMPAERRLEIDEPVDLRVAEVLLREQQQGRQKALLPETIEAVVLDFDGVLTDNRVLVGQDGLEAVCCDRGDGLGLEQLRRRNMRLQVLSKERNAVVAARCKKLKLPCAHGIDEKLPWLRRWAVRHDLNLSNVVYVGNDVNDLPPMKAVGCPVAVADAHRRTKQAAKIVLSKSGGRGAVRELTDLILEQAKGVATVVPPVDLKVAGRRSQQPRTALVGGRPVGPGQPVYVIGEIGLNHNGDLELAKKLIDAASLAGCDAVKFQKRTPEVCVPAEQRDVPRDTPWGVMSYLDYRKRVEFGYDEYAEIDAYCRSKSIDWFASCWDEESVDFIEQFDPPCYKLASATITDDDLLRKHLSTKRPIMLSTGMSTMQQIRHAVSLLHEVDLLVAHSTSTYPCPPEELNLQMVETLAREFPDCPIGYSGHETGLSTTYAAVALGASFIERHITLDRAMWGSDQAASVEPWGLMRLVRDIRTIERALGDGVKRVYESELGPMRKLRRAA